MKIHPLCVAALIAASMHAVVFAGLVIFVGLGFIAPGLLEAYGDSDREGFSVAAVDVENPGAYKVGDDFTPGGDGAEDMDEDPETVETPPEKDTPEPPAVAEASTMPEPPKIELIESEKPDKRVETTPKKTEGLPGATGGSQMPVGTPSAGGRVGSSRGVRMLSQAKPRYPFEAKQNGIEGKSVIWLRISTDGRVLECRLHQTSGSDLLDNAALSWARGLRFTPAYRAGVPVEAIVTKPVNFELTATP